jgi:hypothetical protein
MSNVLVIKVLIIKMLVIKMLVIEGIELNDIKYKSLYIEIKLLSQYKLKRWRYIVI